MRPISLAHQLGGPLQMPKLRSAQGAHGTVLKPRPPSRRRTGGPRPGGCHAAFALWMSTNIGLPGCWLRLWPAGGLPGRDGGEVGLPLMAFALASLLSREL